MQANLPNGHFDSVYIHVPFCRRRCGYCNFTLIAHRDDLKSSYLEAIDRELDRVAPGTRLKTLFFGGGTPSDLSAEELDSLFRILSRRLQWGGAEVSLEANPEDLTKPGMLDVLQKWHVNRLSLGVQSFNEDKLRTLEREHSASVARSAIETARKRFSSVSVDLIFAAPGESLSQWQADLQTAIDLGCDHVSTYGLTWEQGAYFWARESRGELKKATEGLEAEMYESAIDMLTQHGYEHYEVSNFAKPGHSCQHNMVYWKGLPYEAFGPGAARYVDGLRQMNHRSVTTYIKRIMSDQSAVFECERLDPKESSTERLVFMLRMRNGADRNQFHEATGFSIEQILGPNLDTFLEWGALEWRGNSLRLTRKGLLVSDSLWSRVLSK